MAKKRQVKNIKVALPTCLLMISRSIRTNEPTAPSTESWRDDVRRQLAELHGDGDSGEDHRHPPRVHPVHREPLTIAPFVRASAAVAAAKILFHNINTVRPVESEVVENNYLFML